MSRRLSRAEIEALYRRHGPMCLRRARQFVPDAEAEEVLQEVFVKLLAEPGAMRHDAAPGAWLHRVTTRACLDRMRATRRYDHLVARSAELLPTELAGDELADARAFLAALGAHLDPELVHVGVLYHLDGLTTAAIGQELGVSDRTVANRLRDLSTKARALAGEAASIGPPVRLGGR